MINDTHDAVLRIEAVLLGVNDQGGLLRDHQELKGQVADLKAFKIKILAICSAATLAISALWAIVTEFLRKNQ